MILGVLGGLAAALAAALGWWNLRRIRTARIAASLPPAVCEHVLAAIDEAGVEDGRRVLMLRIIEGTASGSANTVEAPSRRLALVQLKSPPLSRAWNDRTVVLLRDEAEVIGVRAAILGEDEDQALATTPAGATRPATLWLPQPDITDAQEGDDFPPSPYDPAFLCRRIPKLRELLEGHGDTPERLLPYIMVPGLHTHEIDTFLVSLMGGTPELIQGEHEPTCPTCARPLEFLFQVGDSCAPGAAAADAKRLPRAAQAGLTECPTSAILSLWPQTSPRSTDAWAGTLLPRRQTRDRQRCRQRSVGAYRARVGEHYAALQHR